MFACEYILNSSSLCSSGKVFADHGDGRVPEVKLSLSAHCIIT